MIASMRAAELYGKATVVFDTVGGRYGEAAFRAMAPGGRYVVFGFAAGGTDPASAFPSFPVNLLLVKGQTIIGSMGSSRGALRDEMFEMVRTGRLQPGKGAAAASAAGGTGVGVAGLAGFEAAFREVAERRAVGKVVITVQSTTDGCAAKL